MSTTTLPTSRSRSSSRSTGHAKGVWWWQRLAVFGLAGLLLWAPVPLGSNRPWAMAALALVAWLLVLVYVGGAVWCGRARFRRRLLGLWPLAAPVAAFALLLAGQLAAPAWAAGVLASIDPYNTRLYLLCTLTYLAVAVLVVLVARDARHAQAVLAMVVAAGVLQGALAALLAAQSGPYQYLFMLFEKTGRAYGTYPNPDHMAGHMELCLSAGLGLMLAQFGGSTGTTKADWRQKLLVSLQFVLSRKMLLRLVMVVMVVALVMSHSRMGNGAFFLALLLVGALVAAMSPRLRKPAMWLVVSMAVIDLVIIGQWVGLGRVVERLQDTAQATAVDNVANTVGGIGLQPKREESIQERLRVPRLSLPLWQAHPWFGQGGGTYYLSFPQIKPPGFPHFWNHTHNDYVEIAVDTGAVGLGLLLLAAAATAWRAAQMLRDSEPRLKRGVGAAALMALLSMAIHSVVDFNLQIPANALTLVALMALVWAMPAASSSFFAAPKPSSSRS